MDTSSPGAGEIETAGASRRAIEKIPTHIEGVDDVLRGGIPKGRMTLLVGGPGTGKTLVALEFLYRSALAGGSGVLVAFEERADALRRNAWSLGWDLEQLEKEGKLFLLEAHVDPETIIAGQFTLKALLAIIEGITREIGAERIVFDAIDVPLRLFGGEERERAELYALHDWLVDHGMTSIVTAKTGEPGVSAPPRYEFLDYMANTVIWLDQRVTGQVSTRRLRVVKYRGSDFDRNEYPYIIREQGVRLTPLTSIQLRHQPMGEMVSVGHPQLDAMLGGGLSRVSSVLITGTSGTGKTLLASTFARAACERGERVLYITFEESQEAMIGALRSPGVDLRPYVENGTLQIISALPEAMGAEEHLIRAVDAITALDPAHVIMDAASSTERFRGEYASFDFLVRFINICKDQGRTCILTNQLSGLEQAQQVSGLGISSIIDTVILLRLSESNGELNRSILVLKSRGAAHSNQLREFRITSHGIELPEAYVGAGGSVTGVARQQQEARDAAEKRRMEQMMRAKQAEITQVRAALEAHTAEFMARLEQAQAEFEAMRFEFDERERAREERLQMRGA